MTRHHAVTRRRPCFGGVYAETIVSLPRQTAVLRTAQPYPRLRRVNQPPRSRVTRIVRLPRLQLLPSTIRDRNGYPFASTYQFV